MNASYRYAGFDPEMEQYDEELKSLGGGIVQGVNVDLAMFIKERQNPNKSPQTLWPYDQSIGLRDIKLSASVPSSQNMKFFTVFGCEILTDNENAFTCPLAHALVENVTPWLMNGFNACILNLDVEGDSQAKLLFGDMNKPDGHSANNNTSLAQTIFQSLFHLISRKKRESKYRVGISAWSFNGQDVVDLLVPVTESNQALDFATIECNDIETALNILHTAKERANKPNGKRKGEGNAKELDRCHFFTRIMIYNYDSDDDENGCLACLYLVNLLGMVSVSSKYFKSLSEKEKIVVRDRNLQLQSVFHMLQEMVTISRNASGFGYDVIMNRYSKAMKGDKKLTSARNSKLATILAPLLQGNMKTTILGHLTDGEEHWEEAKSLLHNLQGVTDIKTGCFRLTGVAFSSLRFRQPNTVLPHDQQHHPARRSSSSKQQAGKVYQPQQQSTTSAMEIDPRISLENILNDNFAPVPPGYYDNNFVEKAEFERKESSLARTAPRDLNRTSFINSSTTSGMSQSSGHIRTIIDEFHTLMSMMDSHPTPPISNSSEHVLGDRPLPPLTHNQPHVADLLPSSRSTAARSNAAVEQQQSYHVQQQESKRPPQRWWLQSNDTVDHAQNNWAMLKERYSTSAIESDISIEAVDLMAHDPPRTAAALEDSPQSRKQPRVEGTTPNTSNFDDDSLCTLPTLRTSRHRNNSVQQRVRSISSSPEVVRGSLSSMTTALINNNNNLLPRNSRHGSVNPMSQSSSRSSSRSPPRSPKQTVSTNNKRPHSHHDNYEPLITLPVNAIDDKEQLRRINESLVQALQQENQHRLTAEQDLLQLQETVIEQRAQYEVEKDSLRYETHHLKQQVRKLCDNAALLDVYEAFEHDVQRLVKENEMLRMTNLKLEERMLDDMKTIFDGDLIRGPHHSHHKILTERLKVSGKERESIKSEYEKLKAKERHFLMCEKMTEDATRRLRKTFADLTRSKKEQAQQALHLLELDRENQALKKKLADFKQGEEYLRQEMSRLVSDLAAQRNRVKQFEEEGKRVLKLNKFVQKHTGPGQSTGQADVGYSKNHSQRAGVGGSGVGDKEGHHVRFAVQQGPPAVVTEARIKPASHSSSWSSHDSGDYHQPAHTYSSTSYNTRTSAEEPPSLLPLFQQLAEGQMIEDAKTKRNQRKIVHSSNKAKQGC